MDTMNSTGDRVLIVDDDFTICEFLSEILKNEGYRPIVFTHPHDVLTFFFPSSMDNLWNSMLRQLRKL